MEFIKENHYAHRREGFKDDPDLTARLIALEKAIVEDLRARLTSLFDCHPYVRLVRCGEVAESFYAKACMSDTYLPHPSINGWANLSEEEKQCLQDIIRRLWPPRGRG